MNEAGGNPLDTFIAAACVPVGESYSSGTLDDANALLAAHPDIAHATIFSAAVLGDDDAIGSFIDASAASATEKGGPHEWDPLTYLCFSRYLRLDQSRSAGFVRTAKRLIGAGASANTGFFSDEHEPTPEFESVLYGAAGIAHNAELTRLLLEHGADANDGEVTYHSPEGFDNAAMQVLVESGKLTQDSLTTMLVRKLDWTDYEGASWLLAHGADPNHVSHWRSNALGHSLRHDNSIRFIELLLDYGADPSMTAGDGLSAFDVAARTGRADALDAFEDRGFAVGLDAETAMLAACAHGDRERVKEIAERNSAVVDRLAASGDPVLIDFAGAGNTTGVALLLDLGFDVAAGRAEPPWRTGETALHLAVLRERQETIELLITRGAPLEVVDANGNTPLAVAVRAMTELSEWTPHSSTAIIATLLAAGARVDSVTHPSGSAEADELLDRYRHTSRQ